MLSITTGILFALPGEKLTIAELAPPRNNPEQNGVPLFKEATTNLDLNGTVFGYNPLVPMVMVAPGKAMIRWQQLSTLPRQINCARLCFRYNPTRCSSKSSIGTPM